MRPSLPRRGSESGQAMVLGALIAGLVALAVLAGVVTVTLRVEATAALAAAVDGAAVAARQASAPIAASLEVQFASYRCLAVTTHAGGRGWTCGAVPGTLTLPDVSGLAFADGGDFGFGPDPAWAEQAGCIGTRWVSQRRTGAWRICLSQSLVAATAGPPDPSVAAETAEAWLAANLRNQSLLEDGVVTGVSAGPDGQVTVSASARLRVHAFGPGTLTATATAWPGR